MSEEKYFVCTYGNFEGREDILKISKERDCYLLHKDAKYPYAIDEINKGDIILLKDNEYIIAYGASTSKKICIDDGWKYKIQVEEWKKVDPPVHSYGIRWNTVRGGSMAPVKQVTESWAKEKINDIKSDDKYIKSLSKDKAVFELGLADIASWYYDDIDSSEGIRASIPILQRGLVWSGQQNEILWDSLMRGIPVGSILLCPEIKEQCSSNDSRITHLLLDGQQRCNAISLGFNKTPFIKDENNLTSILWLDLNPQGEITEGLGKTSRRYLCRITTPAHPWGYLVTDEKGKASCLSAGEIRAIKEKYKEKQKLYPNDVIPAKASLPIPLSYLTHAFMASGSDSDIFWKEVLKNIDAIPWQELKGKLEEFIKNETNKEQRKFILKGIRYAMNAKIVAMNAPKEIVLEKNTATEENTSTLEHLFLRINRQGTQLDGEELIYSTIKSYWPNIATHIDNCANKRMPASKLLLCAIKATLGHNKEITSCNYGITVGRIRELVGTEEGTQVLTYLKNSLQKNCETIDKWLSINENKENGLPPVLYTSIAHHAIEIYVFLLILAQNQTSNQPLSSKFVTQLTLLLYFFDYRIRSSRRARAINEILKGCNGLYSEDTITTQVKEILKRSEDRLLLDIVNLKEVLKDEYPNYASITDSESVTESQVECFDRFNWNRDLLLYAQRKYLSKAFPDYDPARKDLWSEYNRPWDYDHIKAQKTVNSWKNSDANWWLWSIGNFAAIPFEENRSKQDSEHFEYYDNEFKESGNCFFDVKKFKDDTCNKETFASIVKERFLNIYNELYGQVKIFAESHPSSHDSPSSES